MFEPRTPFLAPFRGEDALELSGRHMVRVIAEPRQDVGKLGRQKVARIQRDHLPKFHGRAAQVRQAFSHAGGVAGRQQHIAHLRTLAVGKPPRALGQHPAGDAPGQPSELAQPREPPAGDGSAVTVAVADSITIRRSRGHP